MERWEVAVLDLDSSGEQGAYFERQVTAETDSAARESVLSSIQGERPSPQLEVIYVRQVYTSPRIR